MRFCECVWGGSGWIRKQDIGETRMKRVLVLSDSHGNVGNMIRAVKREEPDMILIWETALWMRMPLGESFLI